MNVQPKVSHAQEPNLVVSLNLKIERIQNVGLESRFS